MKNNKGFVSISVIYTIFFAILVTLSIVSINYVNKRNAIDNIDSNDPVIDTNYKILFSDYLKTLASSSVKKSSQTPGSNYRFIKIDNLKATNDSYKNFGDYHPGYRYQGEDPDNYIWFNGKRWRIIGLLNEESHGDDNNLHVKIIDDFYDDHYNNPRTNTDNYIPARCDFSSSNIKDVLNRYYAKFKDEYKNMIYDAIWYNSGVRIYNNTPIYDIYNAEINGQYCERKTATCNYNDGNLLCSGCRHADYKTKNRINFGSKVEGDPFGYYTIPCGKDKNNCIMSALTNTNVFTGYTNPTYNVKYFADFRSSISLIYASDYLLSILPDRGDYLEGYNLSPISNDNNPSIQDVSINSFISENDKAQFVLGTHWGAYNNSFYIHACIIINRKGSVNAINSEANDMYYRPTVYLNNNIYYVSGNGSYNNPFVVVQGNENE